MRGPQLENGFTRIANEILEMVFKAKFNGTQFKIIMAIWRYTYGFNRKDSEFSLNFLSEAINSNKQQVKRELDKLIEDKVIIVFKEAGFNNSRRLGFNKKYTEWEVKGLENIKESTVSELEYTTVSELEYTTVSELEYTTVSELEYQERQYKDNIKKNTTTIEPPPKNNNFVALVDADSTKQNNGVEKIESYYLQEVRKRVMCSSKDMMDIVNTLETYKNIDFILDVLQSATKDNIARNGKCKINSFSYFIPILEDRWEDRTKGAGKDEPNRTDSQKGPGYNLEGFLWTGEN